MSEEAKREAGAQLQARFTHMLHKNLTIYAALTAASKKAFETAAAFQAQAEELNALLETMGAEPVVWEGTEEVQAATASSGSELPLSALQQQVLALFDQVHASIHNNVPATQAVEQALQVTRAKANPAKVDRDGETETLTKKRKPTPATTKPEKKTKKELEGKMEDA